MKIISWNVNGYRSIVGQNPSKRFDKITKDNKLFAFIESENPDIICLQETKASPDQIDDSLRCPDGYHSYYHSCTSKKGYSGTVTFTKKEPNAVNYKIGIEEFDVEGRIVELQFDDLIHFNVYFPKGYTDSERLDFKMRFYDAFFNYVEKYRKDGKKIIISGDYNTAHHEIDLARPNDNHDTSGFLDIEREKMDWLLNLGYVDVFRLFTNENGHYSWWSQRGRARENNVGWRIDYHIVSENLKNSVKKSYYLPLVMGSDHCPLVIEID